MTIAADSRLGPYETNAMTELRNQYVPSADGQRFLVTLLVDQGETTPVTVVSNWTTEEKK